MVHLISAVRVIRFFGRMSTEVKIVLIALAVIVCLPIFTVAAMTSAGLAPIGAALIAIDKITHMVTVKDAKGNVLRMLQATTAWPTKGNVTTEFGGTTSYQRFHSGIDIAGKEGEPITTFMAGTVTYVEHNPDVKGVGIHVIIDHGDSITSLYGHMNQAIVQKGQAVQPGDVLGYQGHTGHVESSNGGLGTHLHLETRVATIPVDPRYFLLGEPPR